MRKFFIAIITCVGLLVSCEPETLNIESLFFNKTTLDLKIGQSETLKVTAKPEAAVIPGVQWSVVSDPDGAIRVDSKGNVTAYAVGTAVVKASVSEKIFAECHVKTVIPEEGFDITQDGTYLVYNSSGLTKWAAFVNEGNWNTNCQLVSDIVFTGTNNWIPVGQLTDEYNGTFDGNGHKIEGIHVIQDDYAAFMRSSLGKNGVIKNCHFKGEIYGNANSSHVYSSGIVYKNSGLIENCKFEGIVSAYSADASRGSCLAGISYINNGTIRNCEFIGNIIGVSKLYTVLAAGITRSNNGLLKNIIFKGNISAEADPDRASSSAGLALTNQKTGKIQACIFDGVISGFGYGGIAKENKGKIQGCGVYGIMINGVGLVYDGQGDCVSCFFSGHSPENFDFGIKGESFVSSSCFVENTGIGSVSQLESGAYSSVVDGTELTWEKAIVAMNADLEKIEDFDSKFVIDEMTGRPSLIAK